MPNPDELKGRAKEAAGDLTGNEDLEREGQKDQLQGKAKEKVEEVRKALDPDKNKE